MSDLLPDLESDGGPLIAIPEEWASGWRGTLAPEGAVVPDGWTWGKSGGPICDYDRACDHREGEVNVGGADFIGAIAAGEGRALVVDGGANLAFVSFGDGGLWVRAASLTAAQAHEAATAAEKWHSTKHTWTLPSGRFVVFTAAQAFAKAKPVLRGEVAPGTYRVDAVETKYGDSYVTLFRLSPA